MANAIFGYEFKNEALLEEALTTPSCRQVDRTVRDNQRMEFLGDAVLGLLAADSLFAALPDEEEGSLTVRRAHMVSSSALCEAAARHDLAARIKRSKGSVPLDSGSKTLADAVEAIVGAAYLDGGFAAAKVVFDALGLADRAQKGEWSDNPKGELQVRTQAMHPPRRPEYRILRTEGKAHEPIFTVEVSVEGLGAASASAHSHKEAEARAAARLLSML